MTALLDRRWMPFAGAGIAVFLSALLILSGCEREDEAAPEPVDEDEEEIADGAELPPGHLALTTLYVEGGPEADGVLYVVEDADGERVRRPTRSSSFDLDPGAYEVIATVGNAAARETTEIRSEERTELELVLNAGVLELTAYLAEGGDESPNPLYRILSKETDIRGEHEQIVSPTRSSSFTLPKGEYIARVSEGAATVDEVITIEAGRRHEEDIILNAGLLAVSAVEEDGSEPDRVLWSVFETEEDISGERDRVISPTRSSEFFLPEGEYAVRVSEGNRTLEQTVEVKAGDREEVELTLPPAE